jgi:hypothetical protein
MLVIKIDNFDLTRIIIINIKALSEVRSPNRFEIPEIEHSERGAGPLSGGKHHQVSLRRLWRATAPVGCCKPVMRPASGREVSWRKERGNTQPSL